ncbi:MAG: hypothetical protein JW839_17460 [Candidatus Lokiarchaeota archaeon]|nr:hypothetical protein [Candidatus Lokiarchaeota archaeon]
MIDSVAIIFNLTLFVIIVIVFAKDKDYVAYALLLSLVAFVFYIGGRISEADIRPHRGGEPWWELAATRRGGGPDDLEPGEIERRRRF